MRGGSSCPLLHGTINELIMLALRYRKALGTASVTTGYPQATQVSG